VVRHTCSIFTKTENRQLKAENYFLNFLCNRCGQTVVPTREIFFTADGVLKARLKRGSAGHVHSKRRLAQCAEISRLHFLNCTKNTELTARRFARTF
jgi:hypothetical protein